MSMPTNEAEWDLACRQVAAMQTYVRPYVTPLSTVISNDEGELLGTASYISILGCQSARSSARLERLERARGSRRSSPSAASPSWPPISR